MFVNFVFLVFLLIACLAKEAGAQFSFEFMQTPITDTVKFNHEYDFIIIGAGSGSPPNVFFFQNVAKMSGIKLNIFFFCFLFRWLCNG